MTEKFVASNGMYLEDGVVYTSGGMKLLSRLGVESLREIFLAERDRELGRWRWPENPDFVVHHGNSGSDAVWVHNEREAGAIQSSARNSGDAGEADYFAAVRAYFAAHPEPKPWHGAKPGEVWVLEGGGIAEPWAHTVQRDGMAEVHINLTAARKIWPVSDV